MKTLVICSGGLNSVTLAHMVAAEQILTRCVSFDYGSAITDAAAPALSGTEPLYLARQMDPMLYEDPDA